MVVTQVRTQTAGRPLAGRRVLVPVTAGQEGPLVDQLTRLGADVTTVGLARIVPAPDREAITTALDGLATGRFAWLVMTSPYAVDSLECAARSRSGSLAQTLGHGREARRGSGKVAAVGPATATALAAAGVEVDLLPKDRSGQGLAAVFPRAPRGSGTRNEVLLAQCDRADPTLADTLAARGWAPSRVVAYHNLPAPPLAPQVLDELAAGGFDIVLLTSGAVTERLLAQVTPQTALVAIGPRTAQAAERLGVRLAATSLGPEPDHLAAAVAAALALTPEPA